MKQYFLYFVSLCAGVVMGYCLSQMHWFAVGYEKGLEKVDEITEYEILTPESYEAVEKMRTGN